MAQGDGDTTAPDARCEALHIRRRGQGQGSTGMGHEFQMAAPALVVGQGCVGNIEGHAFDLHLPGPAMLTGEEDGGGPTPAQSPSETGDHPSPCHRKPEDTDAPRTEPQGSMPELESLHGAFREIVTTTGKGLETDEEKTWRHGHLRPHHRSSAGPGPCATIVAMPQPAVILDRDGTINEQVGYVNHPDRFWLLPGVVEAIRRLNDHGIPVIVATNQAGAARGYYPEELLAVVHAKMNLLLAQGGARIDGLYVCPHLPGSTISHLAVDCDCRKPRTGMLEQAARELNLDLERSYVVGDRMGDVRFGQRVGARGILVLTGYGKGELQHMTGTTPDHVAADLSEAVDWILADMRSRGIEGAPCETSSPES